jgi:hypothetical protein
MRTIYTLAAEDPKLFDRMHSLVQERDALRAIVIELRDTLWLSYSITPEGRKYLAKIDAALS